MKKFVQFLSLIMALVMAFAIGSYAADEADVTEPTTAVQEETTTLPEEETTTQPEVTEPAAPTEPEVTDPTDPTEPTDPTDPTDPTQPENPDVVLPVAPKEVLLRSNDYDHIWVQWEPVSDVTGYDVYLKVDDQWVYKGSTGSNMFKVENLILNSEYDFGVKSYIDVDGVKYESEEMTQATLPTDTTVWWTSLNVKSTKSGMKLTWKKVNGATGYRLYIISNGKWKKITDINNVDTLEYLYKKGTKAGTYYEFAIEVFAKGSLGTVFSDMTGRGAIADDFTKAKITSATPTNSAVTLKWNKVEDASGYRVYVYKNSKWIYYKGIKTTTYKVTGLEASTKYKFKVRAYYQANGKTTWGTYSNEKSVTTKEKTVKATRIAKLKKNFTDGDWSVKIKNMVDRDGYKFDYTLAVKGNKINISYDYKNNKVMRDFEYLIDMDKHKVYLIFDDNKTYAILSGDDADVLAYSGLVMGYALDMSDAKNITAKTAIYGGKTGVAETYTVKELGAKKTCYFVDDKIKAIKLTYSDGSTETLTVSKITDTPSASLFKVPSGYKKIKY